MLLRDLTIENFRSFDKYQLNGLARVNLLVGGNNCGKTSVLEAAALLLARGEPYAVVRLLHERGESRVVRRDLPRQETDVDGDVGSYVEHLAAPVKSLFGASNGPTEYKAFGITSGTNHSLYAHIGSVSQLSEMEVFPHRNLIVDTTRNAYVTDSGDGRSFVSLMQSGSWLVASNWLDAANRTILVASNEEPHVGFLSAHGMRPPAIRHCWNSLLEKSREWLVERMLRIVLPALSRVVFLAEEGTESNSRLGVLFEVNGVRTPLGWYGEGVGRLLGLGVAIGSTAEGFLAIDEIDTGLHYSRLKDMWRMVIKAAQELDVQVFATTHSLDCLNGLQDAIAADPDLAEHVAVHRIERAIKKAVSLSGEEFARAMLRESEIR